MATITVTGQRLHHAGDVAATEAGRAMGRRAAELFELVGGCIELRLSEAERRYLLELLKRIAQSSTAAREAGEAVERSSQPEGRDSRQVCQPSTAARRTALANVVSEIATLLEPLENADRARVVQAVVALLGASERSESDVPRVVWSGRS